ncbi:MAG TPA: aminotransferase class III-fold pyridoxal phosphate-dependent enzyme, partial [Lachnospiraceae bacterium]|nr:aminotransferase class III-fold pyridoxal phosphate-dependent enzyme [Lachnospiraceae bacterium]
YDFILERRGKGLMQGLEMSKPAKEYILKAMDKGLLVISAGANILRFVPPLVISKENVDEMVSILKKCFE